MGQLLDLLGPHKGIDCIDPASPRACNPPREDPNATIHLLRVMRGYGADCEACAQHGINLREEVSNATFLHVLQVEYPSAPIVEARVRSSQPRVICAKRYNRPWLVHGLVKEDH